MKEHLNSHQWEIAASQNVKEEDYWLDKLSDLPGKSTFPYDFPKRKELPRWDTVSFSIAGSTYAGTAKLSSGSAYRLFMVLTAVLNILLYKYDDSSDIVIAAPIFKQQTDGDFINTVLPLRNSFQRHTTFKELLLQVRQTINDAVANQNYPLETLLYHLNLTVNPGEFPLFDIGILSGNIHYKKYLRHINLNLIFSFLDTGNHIKGLLEYNASLYRKDTPVRIVNHFNNLLQEILTNLDAKAMEIDILSKHEKKQLLVNFNDTRQEFTAEEPVHQMFRKKAEDKPDNTAVVFEDKHITYGTLNEMSNRLAQVLRAKAINPDRIVGILLPPSLEMIMGILGVSKAGGAYLPLDLDYPEKRILSILNDSGSSLLLTKEKMVSQKSFTPKKEKREILFLDDAAQYLRQYPEQNLENANQPGDLFYLISTSGSTGVPKSVMLEHRNFLNLINDQLTQTGIRFDRVLQFASIGFDVSAQEIFSTLLSGGQLYLVDNYKKKDVLYLLDLIKKNHINILFLPPAYLKFIFSQSEYREKFPPSVKHIIAAGEQLVISGALKKYLEEGSVFIHNQYGPSETHVVTAFSIPPGAKIPEIPPIGKPIANTRIYILDENKKPMPISAVGELYIAGKNVGRGYFHSEDLTRERFIDDPFFEGERMYRSGDLAKWLPDGNIQFIGRVDKQIKIRGNRLEAGEIETHLKELHFIEDAVVIDIEANNREKYLCAYIVCKYKPDKEEIRETLANNLPNYMIPSYFVQVEKIPLTLNGKLDRKALPLPKQDVRQTFIAPANEIEKQLVKIWSDLLQLEAGALSTDTDFFDLGGHSLKAVLLAGKIHKIFDAKIVLKDIFDYPTIKMLSKRIKETEKNKFHSINLTEKREFYPLSSAQKRMYILWNMAKEIVVYNNPRVVTLQGNIEKEKMENAFRGMIQRHESLRTSFQMIGQEPVQEIHPKIEFEIEYHNLTTGDRGQTTDDGRRTTGDRRQVKKRKANTHQSSSYVIPRLLSDFVRPFNLSRPPLFRAGMIKISQNKYILMLDMHHIITDGTSMNSFIKEFTALYSREELPALRIQYKDFSQWQHSKKNQASLKKQEDYWLSEFKGEIPVLNLPFDKERPAGRTFTGNTILFSLNQEVTGGLKSLAQEQDATLYMVLLAIFTIFLAKISGQENIVVGTQVAGRRHADLQQIIGVFINALALRNYPREEKTFKQYLDQVRAKTLEAFENQDYQFEDLVEKLPLVRDVSRNPIFDVMFGLQNFHHQPIEIPRVQNPGLKLSPNHIENKTSKFDLTLVVSEAADQLILAFEYWVELFKRETIQRFSTYFKNIALSCVRKPRQKISGIVLISEEEMKQIINEFNNTAADYPRGKTIHELFEQQVEKRKNSVAVVYENKYLTYKQLNKKANQLAHFLRGKGVGRNTISGIMIDHSLEMIIGILGTLKAGGAYLPIDPEYPEDRIKYMLKDSSAKVLVTTSTLTEEVKKLKSLEVKKIIQITSVESSEFTDISPSHLLTFSPSSSLAYTIYTSGSTGKPKGVVIEHPSVVNLLFALQKEYPLVQKDIFLLKTSYVFDVSVTELFGWFLGGGTLAILEKDGKKDPVKIMDTIEGLFITHINFVPSMFNVFLEALNTTNTSKLSSLKYIFFCGEAMFPGLVERFERLNTSIPLQNLYGPTEAAVYASKYSLSRWDGRGTIPIGKPLQNVTLYILGRFGHVQPIGIPGELVIGGIGVARGYLNNPELTYEKFKIINYKLKIKNGSGALRADINLFGETNKNKKEPGKNYENHMQSCNHASKQHHSHSPHSPYSPHSTIYRTGDLGRWLPDGNIEFSGRIDQQVKIRGFRIEPGEIESHLTKQNEIKETVVLAKEDKLGEKYLCAYVVAGQELNLQQLKDNLAKSLPAYMIPSYFVQLEKIPLTPNGKINRKALPAPTVEAGEQYAAPADDIEKRLAAIWAGILSIEKDIISVNDDFFELGGHSLKVTITVSKINEAFKVNVPLLTVFKNPTIKKLAEYIRVNKKDILPITGDNLVLLGEKNEKKNNLFLVHDGTGEVDGYVAFCSHLHHVYNCWGIRADRIKNYTPANLSIENMAASYIEKIKLLQPQGPYSLVGWSLGGLIAFEIVRQMEQKEEEIALLTLIDPTPPGRLSPGNKINKFTLKSEIEYIKHFPGAEPVKEILENITQLEMLWPAVANYLEKSNFDISEIKKIISRYGMQALPDYDRLGTRETIYYLNVGRMLSRAGALYTPAGKTSHTLHYFAPQQSPGMIKERWNGYSKKPVKFYEIPGDHYSIFKKPLVSEFAKLFCKTAVNKE